MDDQNIPIDIQIKKLLDWLISRRHVPKDWHDYVYSVRQKINLAITDMPEHHDITEMLSGTYINYFHCVKIIEVLKETEKDTKNIFGWYGSQRMKDWQEILNLYEKNSIYLAEAAQLLIRNVEFEIPFMKKQIGKLQQIQEECYRKEKEYNKNALSAQEKYHSSCKSLGITGNKVKQELIELLRCLPEELDGIVKNTRLLGSAVLLYNDFISYTLKQKPDRVPLLRFVIERGNTTTYEWINGEPPLSVEEVNFDYMEEKKEIENIETIDFSVVDSNNIVEEIDFGTEDGKIDWGNLDENSEGITWGINEEVALAKMDIVVEDSGVDGGVAKGEDALSILQNSCTHNQFINELLELEGFLKQRLHEMQLEESVLLLNQFSCAPESILSCNPKSVNIMLSNIKMILATLSSNRMQHLFRIMSSSRYIDRLEASLKAVLLIEEKIKTSLKAVKERQQNAMEEIQTVLTKMKEVIAKTKHLQKDIENDISKRYKGRPVNLMGTINVL